MFHSVDNSNNMVNTGYSNNTDLREHYHMAIEHFPPSSIDLPQRGHTIPIHDNRQPIMVVDIPIEPTEIGNPTGVRGGGLLGEEQLCGGFLIYLLVALAIIFFPVTIIVICIWYGCRVLWCHDARGMSH